MGLGLAAMGLSGGLASFGMTGALARNKWEAPICLWPSAPRGRQLGIHAH
jgi:hypothetical protein